MLIETINHSEMQMQETVNAPSFDFANDFREGGGSTQSSFQFLKNAALHVVAWFSRLFGWIKNLSLEEGLAIGVMITCVTLVFLYFMGDHIINFTQYMYYAFTSYRWNSSLKKQLGAMQRIAGQNKYQKFYGPDNTVFARFIKLFYDY